MNTLWKLGKELAAVGFDWQAVGNCDNWHFEVWNLTKWFFLIRFQPHRIQTRPLQRPAG